MAKQNVKSSLSTSDQHQLEDAIESIAHSFNLTIGIKMIMIIPLMRSFVIQHPIEILGLDSYYYTL